MIRIKELAIACIAVALSLGTGASMAATVNYNISGAVDFGTLLGETYSGQFAYVDSKGGKHLPIHDKAHAQNAMARWNQTQFESPEKKRSAARRILAAARRFGIEIDPNSGIAQAAKKVDLSAYVNVEWAPGYFEQLKKALG